MPTQWWECSSGKSEREGKGSSILHGDLGLLGSLSLSLDEDDDEEDGDKEEDDEEAKNVGSNAHISNTTTNVDTNKSISNLIFQLAETEKAENETHNINDMEELKDQFKMQTKAMLFQLQNEYSN